MTQKVKTKLRDLHHKKGSHSENFYTSLGGQMPIDSSTLINNNILISTIDLDIDKLTAAGE
jgi:hypothetical protein